MPAANNINYATLFQTILDAQTVQESVTGWMTENAGQVIYNGGKDVKIPKMALTGLGDYSRSGGYPAGSVTLTYETRTMTQDRGTQFLLDQMDVNESNFVANATAVMAEFQRTQVIPEIDAYRLSSLATYALEAPTVDDRCEFGYTPAAATIIAKLAAALKIGDANSVIYMTPDALEALEVAVGANNISAATFRQGGFDQTVPAFNGRPIIKTDAERMVSAIEVLDLDIPNSKTGGWAKADDALDINFMVVPRVVPIAIDKLDEPKVFDPSVVQDYSGWKIDYRRYHDLWVKDNKIADIFVNFKDAKPAGSDASA
jgi:hypothetical protein